MKQIQFPCDEKEKALHESKAYQKASTDSLEEMQRIIEGAPSSTSSNADPIDLAAPIKSDDLFNINPEDGSKSFETPWGGEYFITGDGIEYAPKGAKDRMKICGRLEVVAEIRTAEGEDRRRLVRWRDEDGAEHELQFSKAEILNPKAICSKLMANGLRIDGQIKTQGGVSQQIADYLNQCPAPERYTGIPRLGWYGLAGSVFALPENRIIASKNIDEVLIYTGPEEGAPAFSSKGTLEDWQEHVAIPASYSSRAALAVCVAFAAPLLAFTSIESGGFHFYGPTSRGKSTGLRAACSVWGPATASGEMGTWRSSANGLEPIFGAHTDLPVMLDEIGQAKSAAAMIELSYMLGNESGKRRMSKTLHAIKPISWRSLFLSSGEITIKEAADRERKTLDAGVLVRMAHIPALPYGADNPNGIFDHLPLDGDCVSTEAIVSRIADATKQSVYGVAGPAFLQAVVDDIAANGRDDFVRRLTNMMEQWTRNRGPLPEGPISRVAKRFALVAAAGELAIKAGVLPWQAGAAGAFVAECFEAWRGNFKTPEQEEPEFIAHFLDQLAALDDQFDRIERNERVPKRSSLKLCGVKVIEGGAEVRVYVLTSLMADLCKERNQKRTVEAIAKRGGFRENNPKRHTYHAKKMPDEKVRLTNAYIVFPANLTV